MVLTEKRCKKTPASDNCYTQTVGTEHADIDNFTILKLFSCQAFHQIRQISIENQPFRPERLPENASKTALSVDVNTEESDRIKSNYCSPVIFLDSTLTAIGFF